MKDYAKDSSEGFAINICILQGIGSTVDLIVVRRATRKLAGLEKRVSSQQHSFPKENILLTSIANQYLEFSGLFIY